MDRIEFKSYEDLRDRLRVRLMDINTNKERLAESVWESVGCGYALAAYMELSTEGEKRTANVPKSLPERIGISARQIMFDARMGSMENDPAKLCPICDTLIGKDPVNLLAGGELPDDEPFYVLNTENGYMGAATLFYAGAQKRIAQVVGGDYYVLPSSVHEVLILPDNGTQEPELLAGMVKEINEAQVDPKERLGNRVLHYRADIEKLQVAADMDKSKEDRERS